MVKAGGESAFFTPTTTSNGCAYATYGFNVYREQPVVVDACPENFVGLKQVKTLPWEVISSNSVDHAYTWDVFFAFVV